MHVAKRLSQYSDSRGSHLSRLNVGRRPHHWVHLKARARGNVLVIRVHSFEVAECDLEQEAR